MSDIQGENDSDNQLPLFRPFTREELAVIESTINQKKLAAKKRAERKAANIAVRTSPHYPQNLAMELRAIA